MKKLMIAAAVAVLGIAANAASVNWTFGNITADGDGKLAAGWAGYFVLANALPDYSKYTAADWATAVSGQSSGVTGTVKREKTSVSGTLDGTYEPADPVNGYVVVFNAANVSDATQFAISPLINETVGSVGDLNINKNFTSWQNVASVPEPTSGLLLLLGVAGLALRRRRA